MTVAAASLSVACSLVGILIAILAGTPVGSTIVAMDIVAFLLCYITSLVRGRS